MALFRKLFYKKPPDGLLEISERVYVFDCCFTADAWEEEDYKGYVGGIIGQLKEHYPDASILVFNFREGETPSPIANVLSGYDMTIMDYPRHYEGCPLLSMEVLHHFLRSSESWLSLGQQNVLLMHCERGGWPVLAFMLAALLIFRKYYTGEHKTLDMVYKQAPRELLHFLTPLNPIPSQLRYLQYVSRRNVASEWPPLDRAVTMDCVIIRMIPNFDGEGGCRPIFRIYGQDPYVVGDRTPKLLFSTPKRSKNVRHYKQAECELVKIDINCPIQGDVVLECISLHDDMEQEEMMFRAMFNTAFIRSNIVMLTRNEIDILWDAKDLFPKDFRAEVLFSEMDAASSVVPVDLSCFEEKEGLPVEAFAKVQEMFNSVDWLVPKTDAALNVLHRITVSDIVEETESGSPRRTEISTLLHVTSPGRYQDKESPTASENKTPSSSYLVLEKQFVSSPSSSPNAGRYKAESQSVGLRNERTLLPISQGPLSTPSSPPPPPSQASVIASTESMASLPTLASHHLSTLGPMHSSHIRMPDRHLHQSGQSFTAPHPHASQAPPTGTIHTPLPPVSIQSLPASATRLPVSAPTSPPAPALPLKHLVTGMGLSPSPPPTPPLNDTAANSVVPSSPPPAHPSTPPLKDKRATRFIPPEPPAPPPMPPSPPTPPLKNDKGTMIEVPQAQPPLTSFRENQGVRSGMPPPPPPPPPTPPLKENLHLVAGSSPLPPPPPPPPPPTSPAPYHLGKATDITIASPVPPPPPPPAPSSSSKHLDSASKNLSSVPSAPPPPTPPGIGNSKTGATPPPPPSPPTSRGSLSGSPSPPPPLAPPSSTKGRPLSRTMTSRNQQTKKLKPLHWLKLTRAVQGSLWAEAQKSGEASKAPEIDISELESLFSAAIPNSDQGRAGGKSNSRALGQKPEKVQLIDHRRAYNCEIMLSKVKIPLHDLMSSVLSLEDSALDADQVDNLIKFCPTKEEMELLKGYKGEKEKLGKCEQFFLELMQVPRTESKLRVFSFKMQFQSQVSDLRKSLNIVNSAVEQIRGSAKLKRVMQTILSLGNALNQGTARGSAIGFRLDSLLKLTDTRARNNKMTLMHYLCKVLVDKLPELLDFSKDLASLEPASKIQLKYLAEEMQAISKGLEKVVQELSMSENDGPVSVDFRKALKAFLCSAEGEVRSLASLYSGVGKNVDALILYFGEDPTRCPYEQVVSTLLNFVRMFNQAHEENCKQLDLERKKVEKEAASEKLKITASKKDAEHFRNHPVKSVT